MGSVDKRHDEISSAINQKEESTDDADDKEEADSNPSQTSEFCHGLLQTNRRWNELISLSSVSFKESQAAKRNLIQQLLLKYEKLIKLTSKVNSMPATVLF